MRDYSHIVSNPHLWKMGKRRTRERQGPAQRHTARPWQRWKYRLGLSCQLTAPSTCCLPQQRHFSKFKIMPPRGDLRHRPHCPRGTAETAKSSAAQHQPCVSLLCSPLYPSMWGSACCMAGIQGNLAYSVKARWRNDWRKNLLQAQTLGWGGRAGNWREEI